MVHKLQKDESNRMKRIFLITLTLIFSFMQATHAMSFDSLWNKIKEHHMAIAATLGGIVTVSAFIGYKKFQKNAAEKKALEDFKKAHPVNIMFYLADGTQYSKLDHKRKIEYIQKLPISDIKKNPNRYFLTPQELNNPDLAKQKEMEILQLLSPKPIHSIFSQDDLDIQKALEESLKTSIPKKSNFTADNYNEDEAIKLAIELSLKEKQQRKATGPLGKEEE